MDHQHLKAVRRAVQEAARKAADEAAETVIWAVTRALDRGQPTRISDPVTMKLLGAHGDDYLGAAMQSPSADYPVGPESKWLQPIGSTGVTVEVILDGDEMIVRPAPEGPGTTRN